MILLDCGKRVLPRPDAHRGTRGGRMTDDDGVMSSAKTMYTRVMIAAMKVMPALGIAMACGYGPRFK